MEPQGPGDAEMGEAEDSSSGSESEFAEVELSAADSVLLMDLEAQLAENPSLYDTHVQVGGERAGLLLRGRPPR